MTTFLQFHQLISYGPSNPNRDDQGRPKQAMIGGAPRLRMSSQSLKRALRDSSFFKIDLESNLGTRTKLLHGKLVKHLIDKGVAERDADKAAESVATIFGVLHAPKKGESDRIAKTLAFISPQEQRFAEELAEKIAAGEEPPSEKDLKRLVLRRADGAIDIAMFGRMLANDADYNREAAVQVAHAITTHEALAEEDWFTAVDDLSGAAETGAGHLGGTGYGSGIYYQYVCVNCDLLIENLDGDRELAIRGVQALARALPQTTPRGKQNSFAHHPRADLVLAEAGTQAPRDLSGAFFTPVKPDMASSIRELDKMRSDLKDAYGQVWQSECRMEIGVGGTLEEIVHFAGETVRGA